MEEENGKKKMQKWLRLAAIFTGLNWFAMFGAFLVTCLNSTFVDLGLAVTTIGFATQNVTGAIQIWSACEDTAKALKVNWITYLVCSVVEIFLIVWWCLDYASYCGWYGEIGLCTNGWGGDFDGGLVFYIGIGAGMPTKLVCDVFVIMNMIKYTKEKEDNTVSVSNEPEVNGFLAKNNLTVVILE